MAETDIEYNLLSYVDRLEKDIQVGNFRTTKTEDFFLRLFKSVYKLDKLKNLAYDKINTEGIDLIDRIRNLGIQITAQKSNESKKIQDTISKTIKVWKDEGVNTLWILFIVETPFISKIDTTKEFDCEEENFKVYIKTIKRIVGDINEFQIEEQIRLDELIKQETSEVYHGLSRLTSFSQVAKGEKIGQDKFFNDDDCIYFSKREEEALNYQAQRINSGDLKEYCVLGNPCSGKTTFAFSLIQKIERRKIFYLNLSNPSLNPNTLVDELIQISHNHSIVVLDNIQDNINLFKILRSRIQKYDWIVALYLSRYYKTFDNFDIENIYKIIEGIQYYRIDLNEYFDDKVSGIIGAKIKKLTFLKPNISWYKGDFKTILRNTKSNLLKLNIALRYWERQNSEDKPIKFDSIESNRILNEFYNEHNLGDFKNDFTYTYCLLYKNDIAFVPFRNDRDFVKLREKGIILQFFNSDFCYFPNKEYAQLIFDAFQYIDYGIDESTKAKLVLKYIKSFDTTVNQLNIYFILTKFYMSDDKKTLPFLLSDKNIAQYLAKEISTFNTIQLCILVNILFDSSESIEEEFLIAYYNLLIESFKTTKLSLYIYEQYFAFSRLLQISNQIGNILDVKSISNVYSGKEYIKKDSISFLTLEISKNNRASQNVLQILNSFPFSEWFNMFNKENHFPRITNSLSELNTSSDSKKLLIGLVKHLDWNNLYLKSKDLKIDQFAKSLRELQIVDISIGQNISSILFERAMKDGFITNKFNIANLSEYSKGLSDLSKTHPEYAKLKISDDIKSGNFKQKFMQEKSISNFTMRGLEMKKLVVDKYVYFKTLNEIIIDIPFIDLVKNESSLDTLLIFLEFKNDYLKRKSYKLEKELRNSISIIIRNSHDKLELLKNPKVLNLNIFDSDFLKSISSKELEKYINTNKITYAEDILRVLSTIDKKKTIELFSKVDNGLLVNKLLFHELNFSQSLELLHKIRNKVFENNAVNCNFKISQIFDEYLSLYLKTGSRFQKISISDFFKGYYQGYCINSSILEKHLKTTFFDKLNSDIHSGFEIGSLFQYTRRISEITNHEYDNELKNFLNINMLNFQQSIKNEEITKTLSGLIELSHAEFSDFSDELLFKSRNIIISKVNQRSNEKIYMTKLLPDIKKIAKNKGKILLKELKARP